MDKQTEIYRQTSSGEHHIGTLTANGTLIKITGKITGQTEIKVGRVDGQHIYRLTAHSEQELGSYDDQGRVRSHGLYAGGQLGWVDPDGVVIRSGFIADEEEVGRVVGPQINAAAAALLLLFLPDHAEEEKVLQRR